MKKVLFALLIFVFVYSFTNIFTNINKTSFIASVANIDVSILRKWQQAGGFNNGDMRVGDSGNRITLLQSALKTDKNIYPEGIVSGYFGQKTKKALLSFQKEYSTPLTGVFDSITRKKLDSVFFGELCPKRDGPADDYLLKIVDKKNSLPLNYIPPNLLKITPEISKIVPIICLRKSTLSQLQSMIFDAKKDDMHFIVVSGFRSSKVQSFVWQRLYESFGKEVMHLSALPGYSEHQLGTTIDIISRSILSEGLDNIFETTDEFAWLEKHAHEYGFVLSYPKDRETDTGYDYEPWHWRYVGVGVASEIKNNNLLLQEWKERK